MRCPIRWPLRSRTIAAGLATLVALPLLFSSCTETDLASRILLVDAEGTVTGLVYVDLNRNDVPDVLDAPLVGMEVLLFTAGTQSLAAADTTDAGGVFLLEGVPVGQFRLEVDSAFLGDSLTVFDFDAATVTLRADQEISVLVGVTFPSYSLAEARDLPVGKKVFTEGIVLNNRDRFGDGSVHLQAGESYIRVVGLPRTDLFRGDSVRVLGRVARNAGQPIIEEGQPILLAQQVVIPQPLEFTTAMATTADGGGKDAALVRIRDANIVDTATVTGPLGRDLVMTVDDGSGPVDMVLVELGNFNQGRVHPDSFTVREATGLLVPSQTSEGAVYWRLIPRSSSDLIVDAVPFPRQVNNLTVVDGTSTTLTLNWTEVDDGFGDPSNYTVRMRTTSTLAWTEVTDGECAAPIAGSTVGEVLSCAVDGLEAETTYFFQVRGFRGTIGTDAWFGPWSNIAGGTTPPDPLPAQVSDLTVVNATSTAITLNWTEVDDGFEDPSSYTVRMRTTSTLAWTDVTTGECAAPIAGSTIGEVLSCSVAGLKSATTYFFQIRAFRGTFGVDALFGPWSEFAGGVTGATPRPE